MFFIVLRCFSCSQNLAVQEWQWPGAPSAHSPNAKRCLVTSSRSMSHIVTHCYPKRYQMCVEIDRNEWNRYCIMYINIYIYTWLYIFIYVTCHMKCVWNVCWSFQSCVACMDALCCCCPQSPHVCLSLLNCHFPVPYEPTTNLLRTEPLKIILRTSYGLAMSCWHRTSWSDGLVATLRMASNRTARLLYKQRSGQEQCQNNRNWRRKRNCAKDDLRIWKGFWWVLLMFFTYFQLFLHVPTHPQWPSKVPNLVKHNLHRMLRFIAEWMERAIWSRKWTSGMGAVQTPGAGVRRGHGRFAFDLCVSNWHI
jgi:hypothetical protein